MRSNNDRRRRGKEVPFKVGEPLEKHPKRKDLRTKDVPQRKGDQKSRRKDIDLEARKTKTKSIGDIHLRHHHQNFDNVLDKNQSRNRLVFGSLSKIWTAVESARLSQEDSVEVDLK